MTSTSRTEWHSEGRIKGRETMPKRDAYNTFVESIPWCWSPIRVQSFARPLQICVTRTKMFCPFEDIAAFLRFLANQERRTKVPTTKTLCNYPQILGLHHEESYIMRSCIPSRVIWVFWSALQTQTQNKRLNMFLVEPWFVFYHILAKTILISPRSS